MIRPHPQYVGRNNRRVLRRMLIVIHHPALFTTSPIERIHTLFDQTVKGRIWPIAHPLHQVVLDRVIVHVIHMGAKVCLAAKKMLPISPLPYAPLARLRRTSERRSVTGSDFENSILIIRQRTAKSVSPAVNSITQCRCSGSTNHECGRDGVFAPTSRRFVKYQCDVSADHYPAFAAG